MYTVADSLHHYACVSALPESALLFDAEWCQESGNSIRQSGNWSFSNEDGFQFRRKELFGWVRTLLPSRLGAGIDRLAKYAFRQAIIS